MIKMFLAAAAISALASPAFAGGWHSPPPPPKPPHVNNHPRPEPKPPHDDHGQPSHTPGTCGGCFAVLPPH